MAAHFSLEGHQVVVLLVESVAEDVQSQHIDKLPLYVGAFLYHGVGLVAQDLCQNGFNVVIHSLLRDPADTTELLLEVCNHILSEVLEPLLFVPDNGA